METNRLLPLIGIGLMLVAVEIGAVLLAPLMAAAGITAFDDPASPANPAPRSTSSPTRTGCARSASGNAC